MSDERLHFAGAGAAPNAMYAAEHLARYAALAPFVKGRRVLDIACGEGYGSWFLKEWGAREVVGVDISEAAIDAARGLFSREGVTFRVGDACKAPDYLGHGSFDVIVSFETVEHVADPEAFLRGVRILAAPGAMIVVSCPNDHVAMPPEQSNPYHLRKYTFEEFKQLATGVLGLDAQWLLGANVQGYALVAEHDPRIVRAWHDWRDIVTAKLEGAMCLLPSQENIRPGAGNVLYYLGAWGAPAPLTSAAVSAQSHSAFIEPWKALEWFRAELAAREAQAEARVSPSEVELCADWAREATGHDEVMQARRRTLHWATRAAALERERQQALQDVARVEDRLRESRMELDAAQAQLRAAQAEILAADERYAAILASKSWKMTRGLRVVGRLRRGELGLVIRAFRDRMGR